LDDRSRVTILLPEKTPLLPPEWEDEDEDDE
jgi:hypothetical protein